MKISRRLVKKSQDLVKIFQGFFEKEERFVNFCRNVV